MRSLNIPLLIVSLLISITLWLVVLAKDIPQPERIELKVSASSLDTNKWYVRSAPEKVWIKFIAPADEMESIRDSRLELVVDYEHALAGTKRYLASLSDPSFTQYLDEKQPTVAATLEEKSPITKTVLIKETGLWTEPDLKPVFSKVTPPKVTLTGPQSILDSIDQCVAYVKLGDIDITSGSSLSSRIRLLDNQGKPLNYSSDALSIEPTNVNISYAVVPANQEKAAIVNANFMGQLAPGYRERTYVISPNTVKLSGDPSTLYQSSAIETEPIDINGLTRSRAFRVRLRVPLKLQASTGTVTVRVFVEPIPGYSPAPTEPPAGTSATPLNSPSGATAGRGGA